MKIAIISDTHDHIWNIEKMSALIKQHNCEAIIHCGDFCAPFTGALISNIGLPIYACLGNNDEDHYAISRKMKPTQLTPLADEFGEVELDSKKIAFCHYPKLGELLAKSGDYDAVFHGHTHEAYQKTEGKTLLVNPGSICGIQGGRPAPASFGIYDTTTNDYQQIDLSS
ncbi:MAG: metallophosphoesterase [Patescibacteria group bacterium]